MLADAEAEAVSEAAAASDGEAEPVLLVSGRISLAHAVNAESAPATATPRAVRRVKKVVIGSPSSDPSPSKPSARSSQPAGKDRM